MSRTGQKKLKRQYYLLQNLQILFIIANVKNRRVFMSELHNIVPSHLASASKSQKFIFFETLLCLSSADGRDAG